MAGIGGTVAALLATCKILNNELKIDAGGRDEIRAIMALTEAQHHLENIAASMAGVLQQTITVTSTANTETTTKAASLLRIDGIWILDSAGTPITQLERIEEVGGHTPNLPWPFTLASSATGALGGYYASFDQFYWLPRPSAASTMRVYGLIEKDEWTARTDDVDYPTRARLALATFAVKLLRIGVDDDIVDLDRLALQTFTSLLRSLSNLDRSRAQQRQYSEYHTT